MTPARSIVAAALAAVVVLGGAAAATRTPGPSNAGAFIQDASGRALVESGFNTASSAKDAPDGMPNFTQTDLQRENADMGTDFVRFLIFWKKVEPSPGVYDQQYLDDVAQRVKWYSDRGYHVMLDMHQDLYTNTLDADGNAGDGAPAWATYTDGLPVAQHGMWDLTYLDPGMMRAFDNFWNTTGKHPELTTEYAGAWRAVARKFAGNETVVAFDLMNEPYGGTLQGARFESGPLTKLYQQSLDAIRQVDPDTWACLEPQAMGDNWGTPSGLGTVHDPRSGAAHVAFCPHLYPAPIDFGGDFTSTNRTLVRQTVKVWTANTLHTAKALGNVPVILGEFGLDTTTPGAMGYVNLVLASANRAGFGVVYWSSDPGSWGPYDAQGRARNLVAVMNRPYPSAVSGDLSSWTVDGEDLVIHLTHPGDRSSTAYLPGKDFPNGATVTGGTVVTWAPKTHVLTFRIDADATTVTISPAS